MWMNPEGSAFLIEKLLSLGGQNDHLHIGWNEDIEVSPVAYRSDDKVIEWGKIYLRPDDWDEKYFPHVMAPPPVRG